MHHATYCKLIVLRAVASPFLPVPSSEKQTISANLLELATLFLIHPFSLDVKLNLTKKWLPEREAVDMSATNNQPSIRSSLHSCVCVPIK